MDDPELQYPASAPEKTFMPPVPAPRGHRFATLFLDVLFIYAAISVYALVSALAQIPKLPGIWYYNGASSAPWWSYVETVAGGFGTTCVSGPVHLLPIGPDDSFIVFGIFVLYYLVQETLWGRTLGKRITGTMVVNKDGGPLTFDRALARTACRFILFEGWTFFSKGANGWHDKLSGTRVVLVRSIPPAAPPSHKRRLGHNVWTSLLLAGLLAAGAAWGWHWYQGRQRLAAAKAAYAAAVSKLKEPGLLEQYGGMTFDGQRLRKAMDKSAAIQADAYRDACASLPGTVREAAIFKREADRRTAARMAVRDAAAAKVRGDWLAVRTEAMRARQWVPGNAPARRLLAEAANALGGPPPGRVPGGCSPIPLSGAAASGWAREIVHEATGIELVYIPPGSFVMGSPVSEADRDTDEVQHPVTLSRGFYLGRSEVTREQWRRLMGTDPSESTATSGDVPVERVSWEECRAFCQKAGNGMRLPTEAEWEYACRAGTAGTGAGPEAGPLSALGWCWDNSEVRTHPVGQRHPNAWGLYDMRGNVWEWCSDWYGAYPAGAVTDPAGPAAGTRRVYRGGSYFRGFSMLRPARRNQRAPIYRSNEVGLRVVMPAGPL